jgi:putative glycosyltransferase (TIGR04372 family)
MRAYLLALQTTPHDLALRQQIGVTAFLSGDYKLSENWFAALAHYRAFDQRRWQMPDLSYRVLDKSWMLAIGHVAFIDTYIKADRLGWYPPKTTLIAYDAANPPTGWPLFEFFGRDITVLAARGNPDAAVDAVLHGPAAGNIGSHERGLMRASVSQDFWSGPGQDGQIRWFGPLGAAVEAAWKAAGHSALHSLDHDQRQAFRSHLNRLYDLPEDAWYVLLHVREPGYHAKWHRHHPATRNADIRSYSKIVDFVLSRGGWVIRGGDPTMAPIPPRERVIDYATSPFRSAELDVLLCADCAYFVGSNSGYSVLPPVFGKRCALTNWSPLGIPNWYLDDVYIPKLVRHRKHRRFLTFQEMYASTAGWSQFMRDFTGTDWTLVDNTPDDLLDVVQELHAEVFREPLDLTAEDEVRLAKFNSIALANNGYIGSRMSYRFLRRYADLLAD